MSVIVLAACSATPAVRDESATTSVVITAPETGTTVVITALSTTSSAPPTTALQSPPTELPAAQQPVDTSGLIVADELSLAGYSRDLFDHWQTVEGGCSVRERVLIDESRSPAQVDPFGCAVVAGDWFSIYDGIEIQDPSELDIDHVVALAEAWRSGAATWDERRRTAFANDLTDPRTLVAVSASSNRSKSDRDPSEWRPPRREAWCAYASDWIAIKVRWQLTADPAEARALEDMLAAC
jgi:hypothetical protein